MCIQCCLLVSVFSSGADLTALVREAAILALREHMQLTMSPFQSNQSDCSISADSCVVSTRHFTTALKKIKPSVSQKVSIRSALGLSPFGPKTSYLVTTPRLTVPSSFTTSSFAVYGLHRTQIKFLICIASQLCTVIKFCS